MNANDVYNRGHIFPLEDNGFFVKDLKWRERSTKTRQAWEGHENVKTWGLDCGKSGIVVLDIDRKKGKDGFAELNKVLESTGETLPRTYAVKTKSGGRHLYFKALPEMAVHNSADDRIGAGLDIRAIGGMVRIYEDVVDDSAPAPLPKWLAELAVTKSRVEAQTVPEELAAEVDSPTAIFEAVTKAKELPPAVEGEGGDHLTVHAAMEIRDLGVSEETALDILAAHWNPRCTPEWDLDELARKVENAYKYAKNDIGAKNREVLLAKSLKLALELFEEDLEEKEETDEPVLERLVDLKPGKAPEREWLVKEWIPLGKVGGIFGPGGGGKSYAMWDLALCVAHGTPWFGHKVDNPCPVVYISCEDDRHELHRRADGIREKSEHVENKGKERDVFFIDRVGMDSSLANIKDDGTYVKSDFYDKVDKLIGQMAPKGEQRFVIMDTIVDLIECNENSRQPVNKAIKTILGGLARKHNATILYAAHPSKSSDYSGNTAWRGASRFMLYLKSVEGYKNLKEISKGKANYSNEDDGFKVEWQDGALHKVDMQAFEKEIRGEEDRAIWNELAAQSALGEEQRYRLKDSKHPMYVKHHLDTFKAGLANPDALDFAHLKVLIGAMINDGRVSEEPGQGLLAADF